jgi:5-methylcytosine-specific restriction protein A
LGTRWCEVHTADNHVIRARQQFEHDRRQPWHQWYSTAWWQRTRDAFFAIPENVICKKCNRVPATELDHIVPHRGNIELFKDVKNWQGLCKSCHSAKTAVEIGFAGNNRGQKGDGNV